MAMCSAKESFTRRLHFHSTLEHTRSQPVAGEKLLRLVPPSPGPSSEFLCQSKFPELKQVRAKQLGEYLSVATICSPFSSSPCEFRVYTTHLPRLPALPTQQSLPAFPLLPSLLLLLFTLSERESVGAQV